MQAGDAESLRYASLQLRMGIEYLFYNLLSVYRDELPDDITKDWQPQKLMDAILECDADADQDATLMLGPPGAFRSEELPDGVIVQESKAPNKKLIRKHYHRLGFYLHAPVDLKEPDEKKWLGDLRKAVEDLKEYDLTKIVMNFSEAFTVNCELCGRTIKKKCSAVETSKVMQCPNSKCNAIYDAKVEGKQVSVLLRRGDYLCPYCGSKNYFSVGSLADRVTIACGGCGKRMVARTFLRLLPADGDPPESPLVNTAESS